MTSLALRIARSALHRPPSRHPYGPHLHQTCDLHRPASRGPHPVAVVLHGGHWSPPYTKLVMRPLCVDLVRRGYAAWNVEYRRLGRDGGGWPQTFDDVATAIDLLAQLDGVDLDRVTLVGHSAGGQLGLWAAARGQLPAGALGGDPRVRAERVLALAAVCNLPHAGRIAAALLRGGPAEQPERWAQADPMRRIPLGVPVALVHGTRDETVAIERSREYAAAAAAAGAPVTLIETTGSHRDPIDPSTATWKAAADWLGIA
ncbi:MAG TPA: alpha/beta fold hydrolase [Solirubrobacteraceae bacterium]|jgi:acetyl esterase/lipase|nr:alpha/beta fold hydrolase [Solirubrobacteraceae bacterium]